MSLLLNSCLLHGTIITSRLCALPDVFPCQLDTNLDISTDYIVTHTILFSFAEMILHIQNILSLYLFVFIFIFIIVRFLPLSKYLYISISIS